MDSHYINSNVEVIFSKRFSLTGIDCHEINTCNLFTSGPWMIKELQEMKHDLNRIKGKLNNYNLLKWHNHTRLTNRAGDIFKNLRKFKPELLTQAWIKFYEILSIFNLIPTFATKEFVFNSFHLCEAPGAFITALNHFIKLNHSSLQWKWFATTLNPYYEGNELNCMISDDRFIVNTLENWCFGSDYIGNIKDKELFYEILQKAEIIKPVHLITADGSIDCQENPGEQESAVSSLNYCEMVVALNILEKGGNFVMKIFTIFECQTVCLLYILHCSFKSIELIKPVCSKEGNSEVYVVCLDYFGKDHILPLLEILTDNYDKFTESKIGFSNEDLPVSFVNKIIECAKYFKFLQVSAIERNIRLYENKMNKKQRIILGRIRAAVAKQFISKYNIGFLPSEQCIVQDYSSYKFSLTYSSKDEDFSFADKILESTVDTEALLIRLKTKLACINVEWPSSEDVYWIDGPLSQNAEMDAVICMRIGRKIENLNSSVFCMSILIEARKMLENDIISNYQQIDSDENFLFNEWHFLNNNEELSGKHFLNFNNFKQFWLNNYYNQQLFVINEIINTLNSMKIGDSLIVKNFPLISQFNVGLVYILGNIFQRIGFVNPTDYGFGLIFYHLKSLTGYSYLNEAAELLKSHENTNRTIVSLVHIKELYREEFYKCITCINHAVLKLTSLHIIDLVVKEK
ncbi:hypothetical protein O3M35_000217 [Rhynocoris fuscipes]|uniref:Cap-specific mRNA (nucleoside-2'-O-)-methyltransferase 2 n=1 Tax=Rhynocoris fuscipes TaxID=488301 RepID=A0AAW1DRA6_9HEMI